jgi:hypothetical protein
MRIPIIESRSRPGAMGSEPPRWAYLVACLAVSGGWLGLLALIPTGLPPEPPPVPRAVLEPLEPAPWTPAIDPAVYYRLGLDPVPVRAAPVPVNERPEDECPEPALAPIPGAVSSRVDP